MEASPSLLQTVTGNYGKQRLRMEKLIPVVFLVMIKPFALSIHYGMQLRVTLLV
jgi:hypothetical protein